MSNDQLPTGSVVVGEQKQSIIKTLAEVEKEHIEEVMGFFKGNKVETAKALEISLKTLYNKLHEYGKMKK